MEESSKYLKRNEESDGLDTGYSIEARKRAREAAERIKQTRVARSLQHGDVAKAATTFLGKTVQATQVRYWEIQFSRKAEEEYLEALCFVLQVDGNWISHGIGNIPHAQDITQPVVEPILDSATRKRLAIRAKARREEVGISANELTSILNANVSLVLARERALPKYRDEELESRWEKAIFVAEGWLRNEELKPYHYSEVQSGTQPKTNTIAEEMAVLSTWLTRKSTFKRTYQYSDLDANEQRAVNMMCQRYGMHGEDRSTLQATADEFGLTRERVRQITFELTERSNEIIAETKCFDLLEERIALLVPAKLSELDTELRELLGENLSITGAARFAMEILGKNIVVLTQHVHGLSKASEWVALPSQSFDSNTVRVVREVARTMIRSCGAAQLAFVYGQAASELNNGLTNEQTIQACKVLEGFEWLNEKDGWFWFGPNDENRLINAAYKILSVANRNVDTEEIHAGFVRGRRGWYAPDRNRPYMIEVPVTIVTEVVKRTPHVKAIQHDDFYMDEPFTHEKILSETERALFNLLEKSGGVIAKHTMTSELIETGRIKFMTLEMCIKSTPIIRRLDFGLYALSGYSIDPKMYLQQAELVGGKGGAKYEVAEPEMLPDGRYRYVFELSEYNEKTRNFFTTISVAKLLTPGDYQVEGFEDLCTYVLYTSSNSSRLNRFITKLVNLGCRAGDHIELIIDQQARKLAVKRLKVGPLSEDTEKMVVESEYGS